MRGCRIEHRSDALSGNRALHVVDPARDVSGRAGGDQANVHGFVRAPWRSHHALSGGPAAVDRQRRAGDRAAGLGAQEDRERAELGNLDETLARLGGEDDLLDHLLARQAVRLGLLVDLALDQGRAHIARADRVAGDVQGRGLERHDLGQADHAMLGGDVGRLVGRGDQAVRRGDVDDPAPAPPAHARQGGVDRVVVGREVDRQDRLPPGRRELLDRRHELDARVVDQDVERAEFRLGLAHHPGDLLALAHVGAVIAYLDVAARGQAGAQALDRRRLAEAVQGEVAAGLGERGRDAEPDAAGRAGHQGRFTLERQIRHRALLRSGAMPPRLMLRQRPPPGSLA